MLSLSIDVVAQLGDTDPAAVKRPEDTWIM